MKRIPSIIIAIILIGCYCLCSYYEHHYTRENCIVIRVENNTVTVKDKCDFVWEFEGTEGFTEGDKVNLKMFDNCSDCYIEDDEIVKVIKVDE